MQPPYLMSPWTEEFGVGGHTCEVCLKGDIPTPMLFAYRVLGLAPHQRHQILNVQKSGDDGYQTQFSLGWAVGFGDEEPDNDDPFSADRFNKAATLAWVLGYVAGRYAGENGFAAPGCRFKDPVEHLSGEPGTFENYIHHVEVQGHFPQNTLRDNDVARIILKPLFDDNSPFATAASLVGQAVSLGCLDIEVNLKFTDLRPAVVIWEVYIENLDRHIKGWFWINLDGAPKEIIMAAIERRLRVTGSHGYKVSHVNFVHAPMRAPDPRGRFEAGVVDLDTRRPAKNEPHWTTGPA